MPQLHKNEVLPILSWKQKRVHCGKRTIIPALLCVIYMGFGVSSGFPKNQKIVKTPLSQDSMASSVMKIADAYVREYIVAFPEQVAADGLPGAANDKLSDNSLDGLRAWQIKEDSWSAELKEIDGCLLWGRPEWLIYGFLKERLDASRGLRIARQELWPISQMTGWQVTFLYLAAIQPVGTPPFRAQALLRWKSLPGYLIHEVDNLKEGLRLGYTVPKCIVRIVIDQLEALLVVPPTESPFYSPAHRDADQKFRIAWEELLIREINPAIRMYCDFLKSEYLNKARESIGISSLPNGIECYRAFYRYYTSLARSPEETFQIGEHTVAKNEAEAQAIGLSLFGTSNLADIRSRITSDPREYFKSRDDLQAFSKETIHRAHKALPAWFNTIPSAELTIKPVPPFREQSAFSSYEPGSSDGSRPGTYWINLYQPEKQTRSYVETTAFHEAYPGHHFQISLALERPCAHFITRMPVCISYMEGWARYAEALAEEMHLYTSEISRIRRRLWQAHGMVVDPGIHVKGWSRDQAVDYIFFYGMFQQTCGRIAGRSNYFFPGTIDGLRHRGALAIIALKEKAKQSMGPHFDIRVFHDQLLKYGAVTLPMLSEIIERWVCGKTQMKISKGFPDRHISHLRILDSAADEGLSA